MSAWFRPTQRQFRWGLLLRNRSPGPLHKCLHLLRSAAVLVRVEMDLEGLVADLRTTVTFSHDVWIATGGGKCRNEVIVREDVVIDGAGPNPSPVSASQFPHVEEPSTFRAVGGGRPSLWPRFTKSRS